MRGNLLLAGIVCLSLAGLAKSAPLDGQRIFSTTCAACHGLDGHGGEHAPDIATAEKIRSSTDEELTHLVRNGIPAAGMPAFGETLKPEEIEAVVRRLRVLQNQPTQANLPGNPAHGRKLFFADAGCATCHLMNATGGFIGPDLSSFGKIHDAAEIRQAILVPGKNFDIRHAMAEVSTRQGKTYTGMIRNEDNFSLQLQDLDGSFRLLDKSDLTAIKRRSKSLMPDDYATKLSNSDLDDLIAYLVTAATGKPSPDRDEDDN
jgi:cytochrome c oxidase cbb3-type subunit 3